jgi:hypothetical protein
MQRITPRLRLGLTTLTACLASAAIAQDKTPGVALFDWHQTMKVRIEAPIAELRKDHSEDKSVEGLFAYVDANGVEQSLNIKIRPRGRYRRQKDICGFPPLQLDFRKGQVKGTEFRGQNKLKLVTHCNNSRSSYEQNLLQEYLAYRIFNVMTDQSFRVRLLRVDYIDSANAKLFRTKYAFFIEDEDELGDRIGLQPAKVKEITFEQLEPAQAALFSAFQYMIGNTDFSAVRGPSDTWCCHNAIPYIGPRGQFIPIPYDFDFSGLVNATYAAPRPGLKITTVTERQYRGLCSSNSLLPDTLALFAARQPAVEDLVNNQDGLTNASKRSTLRFLKQFYEEISDPKKVDRYLVKECL